MSETNTFGCASTSAKTTLLVNSVPTALITPLGNLDICIAGFVVLQANSGVGYKYQWKKGSTIQAGETNQTYTATKKGMYKVIVTNAELCSKTSAGVKVTKSCKLGEETDEQISLAIFPNPTSDFTTIQFTLTKSSNVSIKVFDLSGREVATVLNKNADQGDHSFQLNTAQFSKGIYMVRLMSDAGIENQKLIVQ